MRNIVVAVLLITLYSCASTPQPQPRDIVLQPGQGIAAILFSSQGRVTQISFAAMDPGGKGFEVADSPGDRALYLVPVPAGRYCLQRFFFGNRHYQSEHGLACFTVLVGHISYSGDIVPSFEPGQGNIDRQFFPAAFLEMLHQQYPEAASTYPLAAPAAVPAGVKPTSDAYLLSTWVQPVPGSMAQAIYMRNNAAWEVKLADLDLSECANVKQACGKSQPGLVLKPFESREVLRIESADGVAAPDFQYTFDYTDAF
jgi:hypothetical protein